MRLLISPPIARAALALLLALIARPAQAGFVHGFGTTAYTLDFGPQSTFSVATGGVVDVPIYLTETDGAGTLASQGLVGGGVTLTFDPNGPIQVTSIRFNPGVDTSANGDVTSTSIKAGSATLEFSLVPSPPLFPPTGTQSILIGTFEFTAGSTPGSTSLAVSIPPSGSQGGQFVTGNGVTLDPMIYAGTTGRISSFGPVPSPEPASALLLAIGLGGAFALRPRRRPRDRGRPDLVDPSTDPGPASKPGA